MLLEERQLGDTRPGERRAAPGNRIPGLGDDDRVAPAGRVEHDLGEREDRLLRAERRDHVLVGIERDAEAAPDPAGDRLAQLGKPDRRGIAHALAHAVAERLEDRRVGRLARIAHPEVDHLEALSPAAPRRPG